MAYFRTLERSEKAKKEPIKFPDVEDYSNLPYPTALKPTRRPRIAICIPTRGTYNHYFVLKTLLPLLNLQSLFDITFRFGVNPHSVTVARNAAAQYALRDKEIDYLFWLDDDMIFSDHLKPLEALKILYDANLPIVAGLARVKVRNRNNGWDYSAWNYESDGTGRHTAVSEDAVRSSTTLEVDGVGFYCILIKRAVFEKMEYPFFEFVTVDQNYLITEDEDFCNKARQLGYKIHVRTDVKLDHQGAFILGCDESFRGIMQ